MSMKSETLLPISNMEQEANYELLYIDEEELFNLT